MTLTPDNRSLRAASLRAAIRDLLIAALALFFIVAFTFVVRGWLGGKPGVLIFLAAFVVCLLCWRWTANSTRRKLWVSFSAVWLTFLAAELAFIVYRNFNAGTVTRLGNTAEYIQPLDEIGFGARPNVTHRSRKIAGDRVLYDVVYSLDENGYRRTRGNKAGESILFFGGSFTFGEGVDDSETTPAVLSAELKHQFNVANLSFHGWGPHQMLRILETDREACTVSDAGVKHVIYIAIPDHVRRVAGYSWWDPHGPRYELDQAGAVSFHGPFQSWLKSSAILAIGRSHLGQLIIERLYNRNYTTEDLHRYLAVVARCGELVGQKYGADFTVATWGTDLPEEFVTAVDTLDCNHLHLDDVLSSLNPADRALAPGIDAHPTAKAHRVVARKLVESLFPSVSNSGGDQ